MSNLAIQLSNYSFENNQIRTTIKDGEMWFVAKDVCYALNISNSRDAITKLDDDETATVGLTDSHGGMGAQRISIVSESGMYTLVLRCRDAVKKGTVPYRFRKWVTSEVLPTIRKTGSYSLTINPQQQQIIKQVVKGRAYRTGEHYQVIYAKLYEQFKIPRYQELPVSQFDSAIQFLGGISTKPEALTGDELCDFAWIVKAAEHMRAKFEEIEPALRILKSEKATMYYTMSREYRHTIQQCKKIVQEKMKNTKIDYKDPSWKRVLPFIQ